MPSAPDCSAALTTAALGPSVRKLGVLAAELILVFDRILFTLFAFFACSSYSVRSPGSDRASQLMRSGAFSPHVVAIRWTGVRYVLKTAGDTTFRRFLGWRLTMTAMARKTLLAPVIRYFEQLPMPEAVLWDRMDTSVGR